MNSTTILCFPSRGQHLCKFIGTKESVYIRKEFNSHRTGLGNKHGRRFVFWDTNTAAMTSCDLLLPNTYTRAHFPEQRLVIEPTEYREPKGLKTAYRRTK